MIFGAMLIGVALLLSGDLIIREIITRKSDRLKRRLRAANKTIGIYRLFVDQIEMTCDTMAPLGPEVSFNVKADIKQMNAQLRTVEHLEY